MTFFRVTHWTGEKVDELKRLWPVKTAKEIADIFGAEFSDKAVELKASGLRLRKQNSPWNPETVGTLVRLQADGLSASQIAAAIGGLTRNAVIGKISRLKLVCHRKTQPRLPRVVRPREITLLTREQKATRQRERVFARASGWKERTAPDVELAPEQPQPQEFLALTFSELQRGDCRYPRGEGEGIRYCGQPATRQSYCDHCYRICYAKTPPPAERTHLRSSKLSAFMVRRAA